MFNCRLSGIPVLFLLLLTVTTMAQQPGPPAPTPKLFVIMPPGGQAGAGVEVTISGQDLDEPEELMFSHPGITAEMLSAPTPTPEPRNPGGRRVAQLASVRFRVNIAKDVPLGSHDVRIITKRGVSNPRAFIVGEYKEVLEQEPNNDLGEAQRVDVNTTINGTISTPTDVDYFVFTGKKGQKVIVSCQTTSIDSRLQADLQLFHGNDKLAANRHYRGGDALLDAVLPVDGDYYVRLCSFAYMQGNAEYFYRLTITTAPWIDAIYPPVIVPGKLNKLTIYGRNLPGGQADPLATVDGKVVEKVCLTLDERHAEDISPQMHLRRSDTTLQRLNYLGFVPAKSTFLDGFAYRTRNDSGNSNLFLLTYACHPVMLDNEANHTAESAQEITVPCEIVGRVEKQRARHWYSFKAKKGETYYIEAFGDRIGSPIDIYFVLRNARNNQVIAESNDNPESLHPFQFFTRSEDPARYRFAVPADGEYHLQVSSRQADAAASVRDIYMVRIAPEQPDFRLVLMPNAAVTPAGCIVNRGGHQAYSVFVWRLDGFNGAITLTAEGLPEGVTCPPQIIGPGVRQANLVVSAADDAPLWTGEIKVKGVARIKDQEVIREARAATITWPAQQNNPTISRLDRSLVLAVREKPLFTLLAGLDEVTAKQGSKVTIPVKVIRHAPESKAPLQVNILNLSQGGRGRSTPLLTLNPDQDEGNLTIELRPDLLAGTYSIALQGQMQVPGSRGRQRQNYTVTMPSQPITLTVEPGQKTRGKNEKPR